MGKLFPGPHSPNLGRSIFEFQATPNSGVSVHKQGFGFYRSVSWFRDDEGTVTQVLHTRPGYWNAYDAGMFAMYDLTVENTLE